MFSVEYRYLGQGLWSRGSTPMTELVAAARAKVLQEVGFADEARVVLSDPRDRASASRIDLRI
jgi:hypothetical protein